MLEAANGVEGLDIVKNGDSGLMRCLWILKCQKWTATLLHLKCENIINLRICLIAVTSRNSKTDRMRGVKSGMTEYITKPYTPEYLVNVVKRNINLTIEGE